MLRFECLLAAEKKYIFAAMAKNVQIETEFSFANETGCHFSAAQGLIGIHVDITIAFLLSRKQNYESQVLKLVFSRFPNKARQILQILAIDSKRRID